MILSSSTSSLIFLLIILRCHLLNGCFGRWTSIGLFHACLHEPLLYISACFILPNIECFIQPQNPIIIIMYLFKTSSSISDKYWIFHWIRIPSTSFPIIRLWHFQYPSLLDNTWISSPLRLCRQHHHLFLSLSYIAPDVAYPDSDAGLWCNEQIVQRWVWQIRRYATVHPTYTTVCDAPRRSHHVNLTHPSYPCRYSCKPLWNAYLPLCTRSRCTWINVPWMEIYGCNPWDDLVFTLFDHTCLTTHGIKISEILLDQEFHICNALTIKAMLCKNTLFAKTDVL